MPPHRHRHARHLGERFLHLVLPHVPQPRLPRRERRLGPVRLRHRDDRDRLAVPARDRPPPRCASRTSASAGRQVRKWHNTRIYRRLHLTSSESRRSPDVSAPRASRGQSSSLSITRATSSPERRRRSRGPWPAPRRATRAAEAESISARSRASRPAPRATYTGPRSTQPTAEQRALASAQRRRGRDRPAGARAPPRRSAPHAAPTASGRRSPGRRSSEGPMRRATSARYQSRRQQRHRHGEHVAAHAPRPAAGTRAGSCRCRRRGTAPRCGGDASSSAIANARGGARLGLARPVRAAPVAARAAARARPAPPGAALAAARASATAPAPAQTSPRPEAEHEEVVALARLVRRVVGQHPPAERRARLEVEIGRHADVPATASVASATASVRRLAPHRAPARRSRAASHAIVASTRTGDVTMPAPHDMATCQSAYWNTFADLQPERRRSRAQTARRRTAGAPPRPRAPPASTGCPD